MTDDRIGEIWRLPENYCKPLAFGRAIEAECRVPEGYVPVPVEPSDSQLDVAVSFALNVNLCNDYNWSAYMRDVYARMLAAAPKPEPERKHETVPTLAEPSEYAKAFQDMITHGYSFMKDGMRIPPEDVIEPAEPDCECGAVASEHCPACEPVAQEPMAFYIYKETAHRLGIQNVVADSLPWVYDQDPSSGFSARLKVYLAPPDQSAEVEHWRKKCLNNYLCINAQDKRIAELEAEVERLREYHEGYKEEVMDTIEELRRQQAVLVEALEKLARLGNGEHYGNSEGNCIAIAALASVKGNAEVTGVTTGENDAT